MFESLLNAANISIVLISIMGDLNLTEKDHHNTTDRLNCGFTRIVELLELRTEQGPNAVLIRPSVANSLTMWQCAWTSIGCSMATPIQLVESK